MYKRISESQMNELVNKEEQNVNDGLRSRESFDKQLQNGYIRLYDTRRSLDEFKAENNNSKMTIAERPFNGENVKGIHCGMQFVRFAGYVTEDEMTKESIVQNRSRYNVVSSLDMHPHVDESTGEVYYTVFDSVEVNTPYIIDGEEI